MFSQIKISAKSLLSKNTLRLFFASFLAFFLKTALVLSAALLTYFFMRSDYFDAFISFSNKYVMYFALLFILNVVRIFILLFVFAITLGEKFLYFKRAAGEKGSLSLLFSFLSPKKAARAFALYCKIFFLKILWFLFFLSPAALCGETVFFLYRASRLTVGAFNSLLFGVVFLAVLGLCFFLFAAQRFSAAPYYMCLENLSPKEAVKKSVRFTDGFLKRFVLFKLSFLGWGALSFAVLPALYVIPYIKLSNARFVFCAVNSREALKEKDEYPIILTSLKKPVGGV